MARTARPWYRKSRGVWMATIDGVQTPLGVVDPTDEGGAWIALRKLVQESVREAIAPTAKVTAGTIQSLIPGFLESKKADVNAATLKGYAKYLAWLSKHWGERTVEQLDLVLVRAQSAAEEWGDTHRSNTLYNVNTFLRWCGRDEPIPLPQRESRGGDSVIPEETHRRIVNETTGDFRQLCRFLWLTGCRPTEATSLTAPAVDVESGTITLKKHKTRHKGKTRILYLCKEAIEILADQRAKYAGEGFLFRGLRGKPLSLQAMTMRFQRISEKVGRTVTSYMYRHTWATRALSAGIPDTQVAAMLGHSSTAMIHKHYSHVSENARLLKGVAEKVAG